MSHTNRLFTIRIEALEGLSAITVVVMAHSDEHALRVAADRLQFVQPFRAWALNRVRTVTLSVDQVLHLLGWHHEYRQGWIKVIDMGNTPVVFEAGREL